MKAPLPPDEAQRLMSLRKYDVLDTPPEELFDDLTLLASHICQTPIALVSLVDESRQWFKSKIGMKVTETSRDAAFCAHTILHKDEVLEVRDAQADPRFADSPLVTTDPHIRFYAGAPLVAPDGQALGALCVMDHSPRTLTTEQLTALRALSRHVVAQLEMQRQARQLAIQDADRQWAQILLRQQFIRVSASKKEADRLLALAEQSRRALLSVLEDEKMAGQNLLKSEKRFRALFEYAPDGILIADSESNYLDANESMCRMLGYTHDELVGMNARDIIAEEEIKDIGPVLDEMRAGADHHREWRFRRKDGSLFPVEIIATVLPDGNLLGMIRDITERKRAEELMHQSEERYRSLFDNAHDAIFTIAADGTFTSLNRAVETIAKISRADWIGKSFARMVHPDDLPLAVEMFNRVLNGGQAPVHELRGHPSLNRPALMEMTLTPQKDESEKVIGVLGIGRDITERKHIFNELKESEERYRQLFEQAADAVILVDTETHRYMDVNRATQQLYGYSREEFLLMTPEDVSAEPEKTRAHLESRDVFVPLRWHRKKNGERFALEIKANQIEYKGRPTALVILRDITERIQAEKALHEAGLFAQSTIDGLSTHLCVLDGSGTILATNTAWRKFAETNPPAPHRADKGDNYLQVCDEADGQEAADAAAFAAGIRAVIRGERTEFAMEYSCHSPMEQRWFVGRVTRFPGDGSVRVVVAHENVSERKKLEEQFRQSQKLEGIGQLAGGVAHDFNNILAVIQMQCDLLKSDDTLSKPQLELTGEIAAAAQRAAALTRQLLLFSRKENMRPEDLDLDQSINDMTKMLRRTLGEDIQLQFKFSMQPLFIHADAGMVDQILLNLTVNARDAMPKGGLLVIETSVAEFDEAAASKSANMRPGSFACLSVSDTGCGIPREILSRIFEPFFTTKEVGKGTGLGLATVFGIVQQHKGWINVYSEVGQGTTFRIYLPRLTKMSGEKPEPSALTFMRGGNETILFVEDDAFLRPSISQTLSRLGYRVLTASNGKEALEVWEKNRDEIRLLLTDMVMPGGMTGKELSRRLLQENPKLKVIYASGYSAEVVGKEFPLEDGVNFLNKPFDTRKLAQAVRDILDKPSQGNGGES